MKASALANANIALVKYWGKRDEKLILPQNSSISITLDGFYTHTTVDFNKRYQQDLLVLDGQEFRKGSDVYDEYTGRFLDAARGTAGSVLKAKVVSKNNFPTAAGLASSASGFAALAAAVNEALGLGLKGRKLSMLARRGSGSAARSVLGGFVEWKRGSRKNGSDSYAEQIAPPGHWPDFRIIALITSKKKKKMSSRKGMAQSVATSPIYNCWLDSAKGDLAKMRKGIKSKDFSLVGEIAEKNCLKMHAVMMTTTPSLIYWNPATLKIMNNIVKWREEGLECYFTIDAGPQVKIICLQERVADIIRKCRKIKKIKDFKILRPGGGAKTIDNHLF